MTIGNLNTTQTVLAADTPPAQPAVFFALAIVGAFLIYRALP